MNKVLDYIIVKNSFAHTDTRIDFKEGRNYIVGNYGSGKSELIEMIGFAFFGVCSLRGKASTYKKLYVELQFNYLGTTFLIKRKINDASLSVLEDNSFKEVANSTSVVNNRIITILGYDYNIYLLSNYCQQGKLQYFSELTPAKRLQFIDKVSGIEEAKELTDWLNIKRKELKVSIDTLRDMLHKPKLPPKVKLKADYTQLLIDLTEDFSALKYFHSEAEKLRSLKKPLVQAVKPLTKELITLASIPRKEEEILVNALDRYYQLLDSIDHYKSERRSILKGLNKDLLSSGITDKDLITEALNQVMVNSLDDLMITCPHCSNEFDTSSLKDSSHELHKHSVRDLNNYLEFLSPKIQSEFNEISSNLDKAIEEHQSLIQTHLDKINNLYEYTPQGLSDAIRRASEEHKRYEDTLVLIEEINKHNAAIDVKLEEIQTRVDEFLKKQEENAKLRTLYNTLKAQKDLYLSQLSLYEEAIKKNKTLTEQHDLIVKMIKEISEITDKIKKETIPLINYHSSNYLNAMTKGVMTKIEITDNYDLIVDGSNINLKSGAQKDLSSLAFRLSLGQSIILGMLPLFIGDEIDASSPTEVANDITDALETMSQKGYQMLLITHKDTANLENCNIINLG